MTYKLFLDDVRNPPDNSWILARSYEDAVRLVNTHGIPNTVSFDHDLGDNVPTGKDFANFLIDLDLDSNIMPKDFTFFVHSANPCGAENIRGVLESYINFKNTQE